MGTGGPRTGDPRTGDTQGGLEGRAGTRHVKGQQEDPGLWGSLTPKVSTPHSVAPAPSLAGALCTGSEAVTAEECDYGSRGFCPGAGGGASTSRQEEGGERGQGSRKGQSEETAAQGLRDLGSASGPAWKGTLNAGREVTQDILELAAARRASARPPLPGAQSTR